MTKLQNSINECLKQQKAMIAFNIQNIYHLGALAKVSSQIKVPVIAQVSKRYVDVFDTAIGLNNLVDRFQSEYLTFHLDHCSDFNVIEKCIDAGFASVMFDGSALTLHDNILGTNKVYEKASSRGCLIEAELGSIAGVEDGVGVEHADVFSMQELVEFSSKAEYDMLALAIGNAHGHYSSTAGIQIDLLRDAISEIGNTPLVLHGGTGLPDKMIRQSISYGVVKINVSTALKSKTIDIMKNFAIQNSEYNESAFIEFTNQELEPFFYDFIKKFTI